jgi:VanZ family protein
MGWAGVVVVIVTSLIPAPPRLIPIEQGDKLEHILAYAGLMFWFAQVYVELRTRWWVAGMLIALGIGLEYLQGWTGWRDFSYADMAADAAGVVFGWSVATPRTPNVLSLARARTLRRH